MSNLPSYYIITGWAEGGRHSRLLGKELEKQGLIRARKAKRADIIVAHSAGCYMVPHKVQAKTIFLIGAPYWPGRPIGRRIFDNVITDAPVQMRSWGLLGFIRNRLWNTVYIIARPFRTITAWRSLRRMLVGLHNDSKIIIVRSSLDCFCTPDIRSLARSYENVSFKEVKGLHEDCWHDPGPYIDLILKELH